MEPHSIPSREEVSVFRTMGISDECLFMTSHRRCCDSTHTLAGGLSDGKQVGNHPTNSVHKAHRRSTLLVSVELE
jgi:hypothetical protein